MTDTLTRPERATEINLERRALHRINVRKNPCAHCIHREVEFGAAQCPTAGRYWPLCNNTPGLAFVIDPETLRGESNASIK